MFASVDGRGALTALRLYGVTTAEPPALVPLLDNSMIGPFDQCRLSTALARTYNNAERRPLTPRMLHDVLNRYESRRLAGDHRGPPSARSGCMK